MLPYLNNEQLMHLRDAMAETLEGATITYDSGSIPADEADAVEAFITAKRIEGCSEKTLSYYRKTIEALIAGVGKAVRQITTDDLRRYLTNYQVQHRSSKVTIDNIRRILSSFFSWLEDEDFIVKSPVHRIHKVKTAKVVKDTYTDEVLAPVSYTHLDVYKRQALFYAASIFNERLGAEFSEDNLVLCCFQTENQQEVFEQFCKQYFPDRLEDRYTEDGYFDFHASAFVGTGDGADGILLRPDIARHPAELKLSLIHI